MRSAAVGLSLALSALLVAAACGGTAVQPAPSAATAAPAASAAPRASATSAPATPAPIVDVSVGMSNGLANAPTVIADSKGFFKQQGLNVKITVIQSSPEMSAALSTGQVQFTVQGVSAGNFNAAARGIEQRVISSQNNVGSSYWPLVSRKAAFDNGSVKKAADLKGKKVAVNATGSSTEYFLNAALKTGGLAVTDVQMVVLSFPDAITALGTGAVDAALLIEPNAARAVSTGVGYRLVDNYLPNATISFVFTDSAWATKNKDVVVRFLKAYLQGMDAVKGDGWKKGDVLQTLVTFTKIAEKDLVAIPAPFWTDGTIDVEDITNMQKFFLSRGTLTYTDPVPADKLVDTSYLAAARK